MSIREQVKKERLDLMKWRARGSRPSVSDERFQWHKQHIAMLWAQSVDQSASQQRIAEALEKPSLFRRLLGGTRS